MPISAAEPLLSISALESGYGKIRVLHGVDLTVAAGEVVALLGPNGAGKTTLLRALSGLLPVSAGHVRLDGRDITGITPREAARAGLVHVIEGHRVFTQISVTDNLLLAGYDVPRVEGGVASFDQALAFARDLAGEFGGQLVDDNRRPLTDAGLTRIRQQLAQIYERMHERELTPGGEAALRLFA